MKIKQKKQLNLPQLIEWAWNNNVKGEFFSIDKNEESGIYFATNNDFMMKNADYIRYNNTFTVEVEEEITEETKLDLLLDHFINPHGQHHVGNIYRNRSINDVLEENDEMEIATYSIHLFDIETNEFKLIWSKGKMVE